MTLSAERRLEVHTEYGWMAQPKLDDPADLVLIHAALDRGHEDDTHVDGGEAVEGAELLVDQVRPSAQRRVGLRVETVELQIHMRTEARQTFQESIVSRDADAVRVDHHVGNALLLGELDEVEKPRMQRRLPSRELHHLGRALGRDQAVEHRFNLLVGELESGLREVGP